MLQSQVTAQVTAVVRRVRYVTTLLVSLLLLCVAAHKVEAAPGDLDPTFGTGGRVTTDFFNTSDSANAVAIQPDGKIVAAGGAGGTTYDFLLARYNVDGTLDDSFGTNGKVSTEIGGVRGMGTINAIALQPDGKIVAVGVDKITVAWIMLARYNPDGSLDISFGSNGLVVTHITETRATDVALQADGKIVVAVNVEVVSNLVFKGLLLRYNADGTLDGAFNRDASTAFFTAFNATAESIALQPDGKMVVVGGKNVVQDGRPLPLIDFALARFNPDGSPDVSFGAGGGVVTDFFGFYESALAVALQPDGRIVAAGYAGSSNGTNFALARYDTDGALDLSFGTEGKVTTNFAGGNSRVSGVALRADNRIVAAGGIFNGSTSPLYGSFLYFALASYNPDGTLDPNFGSGGTVTTDFFGSSSDARAVAIQADGRIVAAGRTTTSVGNKDFALARYTDESVQAPYGGTPRPIPGRIEAEDYDIGGQAVAYYDTTPGNIDGAYRTDDVDIKTSADGGYAVGYFNAGEWLAYTVDVQRGGLYDIEVRVGSALPDRTFHIEINGSDVTGPINVPHTGEWDRYETVRVAGLQLAAGRQVLRVMMGPEDYMDLDWLQFSESAQAPYGSTPRLIPGRIEAEDYDTGSQAVAYSDTTPGNIGGEYRTDDVDLKATGDESGGYAVGWFEANEWLEYTVEVEHAGSYDIQVRVGSALSDRTFHIEANGVNITGTISVPQTAEWDRYETVMVGGVQLSAGRQVVRVVMGPLDYMDLNWINLVPHVAEAAP